MGGLFGGDRWLIGCIQRRHHAPIVYLSTNALAPAHEGIELGIGDATLTGMGITLAGPLAFQIRRAAYLTRFPGLALGLRSAGAWLLGR